MATTTNVPSTNFEDLQRDVQDATRFSNGVSQYTNRVGKTIRPIPLVSDEIEGNADSVEAKATSAKDAIELNSNSVSDAASQAINTDIPNAINSLGLQYPPITYTAGLTLDSYTKTYEQGGSIYLWGGSLGTVTSGSFDESGWHPLQGDLQLRRDIAEFDSLAALILNTYDYGEGKAAKVLGSQAAQWVSSSTTGLTPNQYPADRLAAEFVDGTGRLWAISLSGYITPDMLGAVGDGVTDDTNVLQAAVNSASKYPVLIPQKRYAITTLNIKDRDIIGLGSDSELVQIGSASYLITSSGSRAATTALTSDAAIHGGTVSVADSSIFSVGDYAILSDELEYNPLDASYKNGEMHRIKSVDAGSVTFEYEIMGGIGETDYTTANASRLVLAEPQQSPKIKNLKISGDVSSSTAIVLFDVCKSPTVEGVTFNKGGHYGVRFNSCIDGAIKDSFFEGFLDTPGHVGYCVMASNATNGLHVTGNTFGECRHAFTTVGGSDGFPANIIIEGNTAKGTLQAAYDTHVSGKHIIIDGNSSYNSKGSGINCRSPHTEIINNEIVAPATHGVSMSETLNYNVKIEGNTITRASQLGIAASVLASDVSIKNNIIYKSGLDGIRYGSSISQINIIGNEITEVGQGSTNRWGIACVGSTGSPVDDSVIKGNVIRASSANVGYGIINTITKSIITNNELLGTYSSSPISAISTSVIKNNTGYELSGYTRDSGVPLDSLGVLSRTVSNPIGLDFDESRVSLTVLSSSTNSFQLGWIRVLSVSASEITYAVNITEAEAGGTMDMGITIHD